MICCAALASLIGLVLRLASPPLGARRASPLAWRLERPAEPSRRGFDFAAFRRGFGHAFAGLDFVFRHERNMRVHGLAACGVVALGAALPLTPGEWRWIVLAIALVMMAEAFNTAIEQTCNALGPARNEAVRAAKDVAAAAVLICAVAAAAIGATVLTPHVLGHAAAIAPTFLHRAPCGE